MKEHSAPICAGIALDDPHKVNLAAGRLLRVIYYRGVVTVSSESKLSSR
jgi:hypothetical protein